MCWQGFLARGLRPRGERAVGSFGGHCPGSTETPEGRLSSEQLRHLGPGAVEAVKQRTRPLSTPDKLEGAVGGKQWPRPAVPTRHQQHRFAV